jgi:hypothetical protein
MQEILEITEDLGQALQNKSQDIVNAMRLVFSTRVGLDEMRSDDGWEAFFFRVVEFFANHSIDIPDLEETHILVVIMLAANQIACQQFASKHRRGNCREVHL